jgi:hypothetical protein
MLEFTFACYYPGETPLFIPVDISLDVWVAKMETMVYDQLTLQGRKVTRQDLRLYKVTIPFFMANCQLTHSRRISPCSQQEIFNSGLFNGSISNHPKATVTP